MKFEAESLQDIAENFERLAKNADAMICEGASKSRNNTFKTEAMVWRQAAAIVAGTEIKKGI